MIWFTTAADLSIPRAERRADQIRENQTRSTLSQVRSLGLLGTECRRTLIRWRTDEEIRSKLGVSDSLLAEVLNHGLVRMLYEAADQWVS